jgi:enamine deaminase RidA (YjgF/YER057c/UK114 family)
MSEVTTKTLVEAGITRQGVFVRDDGTPYPGGPCISQAVIRGDTVYLCGVVTPENWRNPSNPTFGDPRNPPVRACVEARLTHPELLVEIMCTAAR